MKHGYARVSTAEQILDSQVAELEGAGCTRVWREKASGATRARPILDTMIGELMPGDVVIVTRLDRLARSLLDFYAILQELGDVGAHFASIKEQFDTTQPAGRFCLSIMAAFAEYERALLQSRTLEGLEAARARGQVLGRPRALTLEQRQEMRRQRRHRGLSYAKLARLYEVSRATARRVCESTD